MPILPLIPRGRSTLAALFLGVLAAAGAPVGSASSPGGAVVVLDTRATLPAETLPADRATWTVVPSDLLALEADPPKASSDPGYYGREYRFQGDAVVENSRLAAVFSSRRGRVLLYAKDLPGPVSDPAPRPGSLGRLVAECRLLDPPETPSGPSPALARVELLRNAADEVVVSVSSASGPGRAAAPAPVVFAFGRTEIVEVHPPKSARGLRLHALLDYGIVPGFVADDLLFAADQFEEAPVLHLPAEGMFMGLGGAGRQQLVVTWPPGPRRQLRVQLAGDDSGKRVITSVDLETDGQPIYLAPQAAAGLWHRRAVSARNLETDLRLEWQPPFPARWKTLLSEGDVKTMFAFREARGQIWRGVPGSYSYPAWFENGEAFLRFGKKVPPRDECVVYALEPQNTPSHVLTPVDILKSTLGRAAAETIVDRAGRKLRTHHRRGGEGVRRACTCGCTEAIQAVFESGEEVDRRGFVKDALDDMIYFVARHVERIGEYQAFADELLRFLRQAGQASPELAPYLDSLAEIANQIPQECTVQKDNMKSPQHAEDLARRTLALTQRHDPSNLKTYLELLKAWRDMGGAQDYVVAQCHTVTRKLAQEAGYAAATLTHPEATRLATEIRQRCRGVLRHPDGYEIWAEY